MNIESSLTLARAINHQINFMKISVYESMPPYLNEPELRKEILSSTCSRHEMALGVFLYRAQRFLLLSGTVNPLTDEQIKERNSTQTLLFQNLAEIDNSKLVLQDLIDQSFELRNVIVFCLAFLKPEKKMLELIDTKKVLKSVMDSKSMSICLQEYKNSMISTKLPIARISIAIGIYSSTTYLSKLETIINGVIMESITFEDSCQEVMNILDILCQFNDHLKAQNLNNLIQVFPPFMDALLVYLSINHAALSKNTFYTSPACSNLLISWTIHMFLDRTCTAPEEYDVIAKLYMNSYFGSLYKKRIEVVKILLERQLFSTAYSLFRHILNRELLDCGSASNADKNLLGTLLYLSRVSDFIAHHCQKPMEFSEIAKVKFNAIDSSIKPLVQSNTFKLLNNLRDLKITYCSDKTVLDSIHTIYKSLRPLLSQHQNNVLDQSLNSKIYSYGSAIDFFAPLQESREPKKEIDTLKLSDALLDLRAKFKEFKNQRWFLSGAGVLEIYIQQKPNDYDVFVIGPSLKEFETQLISLTIPYRKQGKQCPVFLLESKIDNLYIEITCIAYPANEDFQTLLKANFLQRDFKPCALMVEIPLRKKTSVRIISFNEALSLCNKNIIDTCLNPEPCFEEDPLRLLRLIKWDLKHTDFKYHQRLTDCLKKFKNQWLELFQSKLERDSSLFRGRFRTALLQLFERFTLLDIVKHPQFINLMASLFSLSSEQVQKAAEPIDSTLKSGNKVFYLLFSLYLNQYKQSKSLNAPIRSLYFFDPSEKTFFSYFESQIKKTSEECLIVDPIYQKLLEHYDLSEPSNTQLNVF